MNKKNPMTIVKPERQRSGLRLVQTPVPSPSCSAPRPSIATKQGLSPKPAFSSMLTQIADQIDRDILFIMQM